MSQPENDKLIDDLVDREVEKPEKKELKPFNSTIQQCFICGKIDVYKDDGHVCDPIAENQRQENLEYYD